MSVKSILHRLNRRDLPLFSKSIKFILVSLLITFSFIGIKRIKAADPVVNVIKDTQDAIKVGSNQESWLSNAFTSNIVFLNTALVGELKFKADGSLDLSEKYIPSGAIGQITNMTGALFTKPISGIDYIAQKTQDFMGRPAYAYITNENGQGNQLGAIQTMWVSLRNLVYMIFSVIFIVSGIFIIFRVKISPQAVITIQNSLPRIVMALILVTFSYAIAGLIIDITYFVAGILAYFFINLPGFQFLHNKGIFGTGLGKTTVNIYGLVNPRIDDFLYFMNSALPVGNVQILGSVIGSVIVAAIFGGILGQITGIVGAGQSGAVAGSWLGKYIGGFLGITVVGALINVIVMIFIMFWLVKLFFGLMKTYVTLIIRIILGPLEIAMGAFPNSKMGFNSWFINTLALASVFPAVSIFMIFINYLQEVGQGSLWLPRILDTGMFSGTAQAIVNAAVGIVGLSMVSKLPEIIPQAVFALKPAPWGNALGEQMAALTPAAKVGGTFAAQKAQEAQEAYATNATRQAPAWLKGINTLSRGLESTQSIGRIQRKS